MTNKDKILTFYYAYFSREITGKQVAEIVGSSPTFVTQVLCKHRKMLGFFKSSNHIDRGWDLDFHHRQKTVYESNPEHEIEHVNITYHENGDIELLIKSKIL